MGSSARAAVGTLAVAWATMVIVLLLPLPRWLLNVPAILVAGLAALYWHLRAARSAEPPLGRGTGVILLSLGLTVGSSVAWVLIVVLAGEIPRWLNLGYAIGSLLVGVAALRAVAEPSEPLDRLALGRLVVDATLIVGAACLLWWHAALWLPPDFDPGWRTGRLALLTGDTIAVLFALLAWTRTGPRRRPVVGLLAIAAALNLAADIVYAVRPLLALDTLMIGAVWSMSQWLIGVAVLVPAGMGNPAEKVTRWARAALPAVALASLILLLDVLARNGADHPAVAVPLIGGVGLVAVLMVRHVLHFAETFALTERLRAAGADAEWRADHDDLTGLLGRAAFVRHATRVIEQRRADGGSLAVLWVDLDAFKRINDSLGHQVGDEVLRQIAARLRAGSEPDDLVSRLGGDEFVILRPDAGESATLLAEQIRQSLAQPVTACGTTLSVTSSIGLVESTSADDDVSQLLIDGDLALYQAKRMGRNRVERYSSILRASQCRRADLAKHLRRMIKLEQVIVRYQPVVTLDTGKIVGAEALARIPGPDGHELTPAEFLPHLEALGLLTDLAEIVLARACTDFTGQPQLGWVSVNITSDDLADPRFPERLRAHLDRSGLPPHQLVLEINERVVPEPHILGATQRLTDLGVRVALDDFGTGWSSLAQLRDLSLGLVKIDQSVVVAADRGDGQHLSSMLVAAVAMARALGLQVIAEGIEQPAQSQSLSIAGAEFGQGFLWNAALDIQALHAAAGIPPLHSIQEPVINL